MRKIIGLLFPLLALLGCQNPSGVGINGSSYTYNKVEASGIPVKLDFEYAINMDCSSYGETIIRIIQGPQHGKIEIRPVVDFPFFKDENPYHICNTKKVEGKQIFYTSDPGYYGTDAISLDIYYPQGGNLTKTFIITVR